MAKYPGVPPLSPVQRCPPHIPSKVVRIPGGRLVVECLGCGKRGPEPESTEAARAAFFGAG